MNGDDDYERHPNPMFVAMRSAAELQLATVQAWEAYWQSVCKMYDHLLAEQVDFLEGHHPLRRLHTAMAKNADLMDHYGHRAHDVDVERI